MISARRNVVLQLGTLALAAACQKKEPLPAGPVNPAPKDPDGTGTTVSAVTTPLPKRKLGRTGVEVSVLGLGGFHMGQEGSVEDSVRLVRTAIDEGITFLDNCWDYNQGNSESRMGKALADGYRKRVYLMTKIDGRTKASATAQLEQSLRRLNTDVIDLVQIHEVIRPNDPERCFAAGGCVEALVEAQKSGKLRHIGFTGHKDPSIHLAMLAMAQRHGFRFDTVQMPLNVMDAHYRSFEREVLPALVKDEIGVLGMKSCGAGELLKSGVVTAEECLRYALSLETSVVISGMEKLELLRKNVDIVRRFQPYTDEQRRALLARTEPAAREGKYEPFKTSTKFDGTEQNPHWLEEARL
jgi:aryl-alcohol dehydrogenase-like predicted oxidoreductase